MVQVSPNSSPTLLAEAKCRRTLSLVPAAHSELLITSRVAASSVRPTTRTVI
jgi:hypothetical protein